MRHPIFLSAMVCFVAAMPALAQSFPAEAVILQREVEIRSGPGKSFYPTSKLYQNDRVVVLREVKDQPGWLEIKPPERSFSWISGKSVRQVDTRTAYVECNPAQPVSTYAGSLVENVKPTRESMKLTFGTALIIAAPPFSTDGETWFPVQPHPSEVRYIPIDAVKPTTTIVAQNVGAPNWTLAPNGWNGDAVLGEAQRALAANDFNRARPLFQQVANNATNASQKQYAINVLASLSGNPQVPATTTSLSPTNSTTPINLQTLRPAVWSTYGRLRDTKVLGDNGQPLYALEDGTGTTPIYITTIPGKSLQMYIGRTIAVFGPTMYRADAAVRMQYVVASHVAVP